MHENKKYTVGIIGGNGGMGKLFSRNFTDSEKFETIISDLDTDLKNADLVKKSDIIIVSVPITKTVPVIEEIIPYLNENQLLMDLTSIKSEPIEAMLKSEADVIGLHPMFGPSIDNLKEQNIIIIPARDRNNWQEVITEFFTSKEAKIKITTAKEHDHMMSLIQVLIHFNTITTGITMSKLGFNIKDTLEYTSPIYRMELGMIGRIFSQDPELYGSIPMHNPETAKILLEHKSTIEELSKAILLKDQKAFNEVFNKASHYFDDFKEKSMKESNYLIKHLVEYKD